MGKKAVSTLPKEIFCLIYSKKDFKKILQTRDEKKAIYYCKIHKGADWRYNGPINHPFFEY